MFNVKVWRCGKLIASKKISAFSALNACQIAEQLFGKKMVTTLIGKNGETQKVVWYGVKTVASLVI